MAKDETKGCLAALGAVIFVGFMIYIIGYTNGYEENKPKCKVGSVTISCPYCGRNSQWEPMDIEKEKCNNDNSTK